MTKEDVYAILYLFDKEIRKSEKSMNFSNVFNPNCWPVALDRIGQQAAFSKNGNIAMDMTVGKCIRAANDLTCNLMSMDTLKVYIFGEYIRANKGHFYKVKKDGEVQVRNGKKLFNKLKIDDFGNLKGIELYKPSSLDEQIQALREANEKNISIVRPSEEDQTNVVYHMVCDGKIGIHLYLQLWKKNNGFGIDRKRYLSDDYRRFLKMMDYLVKAQIELKDIYYHGR